MIGCGLQKGRTEVYRGTEYSINLLPKIKLEMVVSDKDVEDIIKIISKAAHTGKSVTAKSLLIKMTMPFESGPVKPGTLLFSLMRTKSNQVVIFLATFT